MDIRGDDRGRERDAVAGPPPWRLEAPVPPPPRNTPGGGTVSGEDRLLGRAWLPRRHSTTRAKILPAGVVPPPGCFGGGTGAWCAPGWGPPTAPRPPHPDPFSPLAFPCPAPATDVAAR